MGVPGCAGYTEFMEYAGCTVYTGFIECTGFWGCRGYWGCMEFMEHTGDTVCTVVTGFTGA